MKVWRPITLENLPARGEIIRLVNDPRQTGLFAGAEAHFFGVVDRMYMSETQEPGSSPWLDGPWLIGYCLRKQRAVYGTPMAYLLEAWEREVDSEAEASGNL